MLRPRTTRALSLACLVGLAAMSLACPDPPPDDPGTDLFRLAINGAPGGSLLAVWGDVTARRALLVGGYVGVAPERLNGMPAGRLVEYRNGAFTTRCTTDRVLWWIDGAYENGAATVYAVGEAGRVLRYDGARCAEVDTGITFPEGPVTYWGVLVRGPSDVWLVGGSPQPTGPRGVVVHFDGARWSRVTDLPERARDENLYKVARAGDALAVVGSGGVVLRGRGGNFSLVPTIARASDNRLFTVSCVGVERCVAVGGAASGMLLEGSVNDDAGMRASALVEDLSGLNGVWVQDAENVFVVGVNGTNVHSTGARRFVGRALTPATLHGVGGWVRPEESFVMAVGGELGEATTAQRAVVLLRDGSGRTTFTFDGRSYTAAGELRRSLGGSGQ